MMATDLRVMEMKRNVHPTKMRYEVYSTTSVMTLMDDDLRGYVIRADHTIDGQRDELDLIVHNIHDLDVEIRGGEVWHQHLSDGTDRLIFVGQGVTIPTNLLKVGHVDLDGRK